jgi:hypothetical protein
MTVSATHRPHAILTAELDALGPAAESCSPFRQGARDALRWLLTGGPGPLTGSRTDPCLQTNAAGAELAAAEALLYAPPCAGRDYAAGVEHALMWAESATSTAPSAAYLGIT